MSDGNVTTTIDYTLAQGARYQAAIDRAIGSTEGGAMGVALFAAGYRAACDDILAQLVGEGAEGADRVQFHHPPERWAPTPEGVAAVTDPGPERPSERAMRAEGDQP